MPCCHRRLDDEASELFGSGKRRGVLYWMPPEGTLLLNNVHKAPKTILPLLRQTVGTVSRSSMDDGCVVCGCGDAGCTNWMAECTAPL